MSPSSHGDHVCCNNHVDEATTQLSIRPQPPCYNTQTLPALLDEKEQGNYCWSEILAASKAREVSKLRAASRNRDIKSGAVSHVSYRTVGSAASRVRNWLLRLIAAHEGILKDVIVTT